MAPTKAKGRTVTGVDGAYVNTITRVGDRDRITAQFVARGEEVPENLAKGELERLEAVGAFEEKTHRERQIELRNQRNALRGAIVAGPGQAPEDAENNPRTPDMSAPPPGTAMAPPMTAAEAGIAGATPTPTGEQGIELEDHGRDELVEIAKAEGLELSGNISKADAVKAIQEHRAESGGEPQTPPES